MKKKIILFLCFGLALFMLTGCKKSDTKVDKVRVAYFPNITHTQALVMKNQGTLEEKLGKDIKVEWKNFNAGPAEIEALFAGEIDLGYIGPVPALNGYMKSKGDVKIIAGATNGGAVLVTRKDLIIKDFKELDGKKVAVPQIGNTQHLSLLHLLSENNMAAKASGGTVDVVAVANADVKNLMEQGQVDAALVPEPWGSILEKEIGANVAMDYDQIWMNGDYSTAVVIVRKDFMEQNPEIVKKFIEAHKEATMYIKDNLADAEQKVNLEIKEATGKEIDTEVLDSAFKRLIFSYEIPKESIHGFAELNLQEGFAKELPGEDLMDASLLQ